MALDLEYMEESAYSKEDLDKDLLVLACFACRSNFQSVARSFWDFDNALTSNGMLTNANHVMRRFMNFPDDGVKVHFALNTDPDETNVWFGVSKIEIGGDDSGNPNLFLSRRVGFDPKNAIMIAVFKDEVFAERMSVISDFSVEYLKNAPELDKDKLRLANDLLNPPNGVHEGRAAEIVAKLRNKLLGVMVEAEILESQTAREAGYNPTPQYTGTQQAPAQEAEASTSTPKRPIFSPLPQRCKTGVVTLDEHRLPFDNEPVTPDESSRLR
ncbi:MAG: hypothetical protein COV36_01965 [Alphaproteobacteria bacterium CG11_big_fil_rev_8_21_14_0_20_44_7]|nr:MAG: hypothetical protein COV36_01965 [Alphaproteobacteria bacterium CG11_big_fil_rev_8_21_14_0_20_44_7]